MKLKYYYTQKTKTGCLLDILCTAIQCNRKELYNRHSEVISFFRYNFLKYRSVGDILDREGKFFSYITNGKDGPRNFHKNWAPSILGVNLAEDDFGKPLHAVFYDGEKAWEPYHKEWYNIEDLKIVYALPIFSPSPERMENQKNTLEILSKIDENVIKRKKKSFGITKKEKLTYLKVV